MRKKLKVLIYEDSAQDAELIRLTMEQSEFKCLFKIAFDKQEFLESLNEFKPDIVISDYAIPGFTGLQALRYLRKNHLDIPFVIVTGSLGEERAVDTILSGANDFVLKDNLSNLPTSVFRAIRITKERKARKESEEELKKSEQRFKALIENSSDVIFIFNEKNIISYASPGIKTLLGYNPQDVIGKNITGLISPESRKQRDKLFRLLKNGSKSKVSISQQFLTKKGETHWVSAIISDQRSVPGVNSFVSNVRNIHETVMNEIKLRENKELLNSILENLTEAVVVSDIEGNIIHGNWAADKLMSKFLSSADKKSWSQELKMYKGDKTTPYPMNELPLTRAIKGEKIDRAEMYFVDKKSNKTLMLNVNARPLLNESKKSNGAVISFTDISEEHRLKLQLEKTLENLENTVLNRTEQLNKTLSELSEVHRQLKYSINYAKNIQQAVTLTNQELRSVFAQTFMINLPKDVVSGDFTWYHHGDMNHLAVIDCTGHGVPGAMLSMIGKVLLDRIVDDRNIERSEIILEELDKSISQLMKGGTTNKKLQDGMDMSICGIDYRTMKLSFSAAGNPGLLVHNGELVILEADRYSIGGYFDPFEKEFRRIKLSFNRGDRLYLFTDGMQDQFGGKKDRKFTRKRLYDLILKVQKESMDNQRKQILDTFHEWKGNEIQIDDVTIVGVEL